MKNLTGIIDLFSTKLNFLLTDMETKEETKIQINGNNIEKDLYETVIQNNVSSINLIGGPMQYTKRIKSNLEKMLKTNSNYSNVVVEYNNVNFTGIELSQNYYGTTKIIDSVIEIKDTNNVLAQKACDSNKVLIGGITSINSSAVDRPVIFLMMLSHQH